MSKITKYACDDCGNEMERKDLMVIPMGEDDESHICHGCVSYRMGVSIALQPLGMRRCQVCEGTGIIPAWGDDQDDEQCAECRGTGMNDFGG